MKELHDLIDYLGEIDTLSKKLSKEQRDDLRGIITTILILLVALRKSSHLGETTIETRFGNVFRGLGKDKLSQKE